MNNPRVSVIMAEFNTAPHHLEQSIKSIVEQTFDDFELVIVDDGGCNDVTSIVAGFNDRRLRVIENGGNKGFVFSLNAAILAAKADYIVRMDTDDISAPDRIEKLYSFLVSNTQYAVAASLAVEFSDARGTGRVLGTPGEKSAKQLMRGDAPIHPSVIFRRQDVVDVGLYDDYHRAEDLALWCKLVIAGKRIHVLDDILLDYRVNPSDFKKRSLRNRHGEIRARLKYYPMLGGSAYDYLFIAKSILAGLLPVNVVIAIRNRFVLGQKKDLVS